VVRNTHINVMVLNETLRKNKQEKVLRQINDIAKAIPV